MLQPLPQYDMREDLDPRRLTIAMWDFSWLNGHYPGGPFADFNKAVDELVERGFNSVRIEAYPHLIGALKTLDETTHVPAKPLDNWGQSDRPWDHQVALELVEFMTVCRDKGVGVILSTWGAGKPEIAPNMDEEQAFELYWKGWRAVLDLLAGRDLLGHVLYVDFDQEFPFFSPMKEKIDSLGHVSNPQALGLGGAMEAAGQREQGGGLAWTPEQMAFVGRLLSRTCAHFQERYPGLRFTYSLTGYWREVRALGLRCFDVLELHTWIHGARFDTRTGFNKIDKDREQTRDHKDYMRRIRETMGAVRPMLLKEMHNQLRFAHEWSEEAAAPLTTSEAWGPWWHMDHPDLEWDWLYQWCEECMGVAAQYGFWGITPWNFSHPYWANWSNVAWYRQVNEAFLRS